MIKFLIVVIIGFLILNLFRMNIRINFKSFFKKGFKKTDSKFGIICYTAKQGMGKTYCAVQFVIKQIEKDKYLKVVTNVRSFYERMEKSIYKGRVTYYSSIYDIMEFTQQSTAYHYLVFFDEIFSVLEKKGTIAKKVRTYLSQLRKRKILFITTAQEWSEINISFRRYVRFHVVPRMLPLPITHNAYIIKQVNDGDFIHWDSELQDYVAPCIETQISKGNKEIIEKYDTFETIDETASANQSTY